MLVAKNRLKKMHDFNALMKNGWYFKARYLDAKILSLPQPTPSLSVDQKFVEQMPLQFAFTVGLKISKKATVRNRLRRQMREVVRLLLKNKSLKNGFFVLFIAKKGIIGQDYRELKKDVEQLLITSKVLPGTGIPAQSSGVAG